MSEVNAHRQAREFLRSPSFKQFCLINQRRSHAVVLKLVELLGA